jgi:hypothetical protein
MLVVPCPVSIERKGYFSELGCCCKNEVLEFGTSMRSWEHEWQPLDQDSNRAGRAIHGGFGSVISAYPGTSGVPEPEPPRSRLYATKDSSKSQLD